MRGACATPSVLLRAVRDSMQGLRQPTLRAAAQCRARVSVQSSVYYYNNINAQIKSPSQTLTQNYKISLRRLRDDASTSCERCADCMSLMIGECGACEAPRLRDDVSTPMIGECGACEAVALEIGGGVANLMFPALTPSCSNLCNSSGAETATGGECGCSFLATTPRGGPKGGN